MSSRPVHIWHEGNLIKVGHFNGEGVPPTPLDEHVQAFLAEHMEYNHVEFLHGKDQFVGGDGERRRVKTTRKKLWRFNPGDGLHLCGAGYLDWVIEKLGNLGYDVRYRRVMPRRPRKDWNEVDLENVARFYRFRPGQEACFDAMLNRVIKELGGVVDATVGFGKSDLIAPMALALPKAKIIVGVRKVDIVGKTVAQLRDYLPSVGQVDGHHKEFGERITVYSMDSFEYFDGDADVAFFDEAHEIVTKKYARALSERLDQAVSIAMTATTDSRADGADALMEALFGPTIFYLPYSKAEELGLVVPIKVIVHPVDMKSNPVADKEGDVVRKRWGHWRNRVRNRVIADAANRFEEGDQVLILVSTVDHLVHLRQFLPHFEAVWGDVDKADLEVYLRNGMWPDYEKMTPKRRVSLRQGFQEGKIKKAIATGVWKQGVSFNQLKALFWAQGGSSAIDATQGPGRVSRIDPATGKAYGEVHEFDDRFDGRFHNQFLTRLRHYRKNGWTIVSEESPAR